MPMEVSYKNYALTSYYNWQLRNLRKIMNASALIKILINSTCYNSVWCIYSKNSIYFFPLIDFFDFNNDLNSEEEKFVKITFSKTNEEPIQGSKMELSAKMVNYCCALPMFSQNRLSAILLGHWFLYFKFRVFFISVFRHIYLLYFETLFHC